MPRSSERLLSRGALTALYGCAVFLSAFLLFQVQPAIAHAILPWFGGSAAVWTTCLLFFQTVLLLGYLYSHALISRVPARRQPLAHGILLAASLLALPVKPDPGWAPQAAELPVLRILGLLGTAVGLPYFILSATSPLLQAWYARQGRARLPYRFFSVSNAASLLGLLAYPFLAEPFFSTSTLLLSWSAAYAFFVLLCGAAAAAAPRGVAPAGSAHEMEARGASGGSLRFLWVALPACATALLLAVTNVLCQDIAPVPFLWILPLAAYLLSYILCFAGERWYRPAVFRWALVPSLLGIALLAASPGGQAVSFIVTVFVGALFLACMFCHGELFRLRPKPEALTAYYLSLSTGGALGGLFVAVAAPLMYDRYAELPVTLVACGVLALCLAHGASAGHVRLAALMLAGAALGFCLLPRFGPAGSHGYRNFYGAMRIAESGEGGTRVRSLYHGSTLHGLQFLSPGLRGTPTAYYGRESAIGRLLGDAGAAPRAVGLAGLGVGTLAAYGRPGDSYRFYEINPLVLRVARESFFFLPECRAACEVVLGDARLSLEREPPRGFDVLALDAFSGDSVPVHLLTRQAFRLYFRHLKPDGVLAVHITNRYLDLAPVVRAAGEATGREVRVLRSDGDPAQGTLPCEWAVAARAGFFDGPQWRGTPTPPRLEEPWTDDYSNLLRVVRR
ncbi:MAG: fused MFS/spermidine synthase [Bryobacterales bacterium]|nr:fused MFS/spermidine synthase [Bryobacterales bacterium]